MSVGGVGVQAPEASPGRYMRRVDEVPPDDDGCDDVLEADGRGTGDDDPFDIPAKRMPVERLWRWRDGGLYICRWRWILSLLEDQSQSPKIAGMKSDMQALTEIVEPGFFFMRENSTAKPAFEICAIVALPFLLLSKFKKKVLGLPPARYLPSPTSTLPRAAEALSGRIT